MNSLVFDEKTMLDGNIFQFEERLQSHMNKYAENGYVLSTYFPLDEDATTVDRGLKNVDQIFGKKSPLRFSMIKNFPLNGFGQANPNNTDEMQVEDISLDGECVIMPCSIVPKQNDFFMIEHLKMKCLFQVTSVTYDSMKVNGFYKIGYRLHSTSQETIDNLINQVRDRYRVDLNALGSNVNPIIREEDFIKKSQVEKMLSHMITLYRSMYYNGRHNCFLFHDQKTGLQYFDMCGNEFMAKHSLMNIQNSGDMLVLHDKIQDSQLPQFYANSIYSWLEIGAPPRLLQKFFYILNYSEGYPYSSFNLWGEGDIQVMQPIAIDQVGINFQEHSFFDDTQFQALLDNTLEPISSEYEKLLWKYIHKGDKLTLADVSLLSADPLISGAKYCKETYLLTPIMIFIIRRVLQMN